MSYPVSHFRPATLLVLLLIGLWGCTGCGSDDTTPPPSVVPKKTYQVPTFNRDSAYAYVAKQVSFGPRVPNSAAHTATKEWLAEQLRKHGAQVKLQNFTPTTWDGKKLNSTNIIGQFNPAAKRRILLAAHWDTRGIADQDEDTSRYNEPIDGADDGGSGVGVLLEVARQLRANPIEELGIDIVFFDAEDSGKDSDEGDGDQYVDSWAMGAQHWAKNPHVPARQFKYGILLDMVGAKGAKFGKEDFSMQVAPQLVNKIWQLAQQMGYGQFFMDQPSGAALDDHYFVIREAKIPMIDIINKDPEGFGDHWHTHGDNLDVIDKRTLGVVGQVLLATLYREASGTL